MDRCFLSGFRNCAALRVLDLSRCAAVDDVALRPLLLPSLRHLKLSLCVQVTDAGARSWRLVHGLMMALALFGGWVPLLSSRAA